MSNIKISSKHTLIKINPLTIIIVFLSLIFGRFNYIFIHYIIALFHEICHVLTAKIFKIKVNSISFLPFGFYAKMDELEKEKPMRQLLVIIMGPLSFFPVWLILNILRLNFIISSYTYDFAFTSAHFSFSLASNRITCAPFRSSRDTADNPLIPVPMTSAFVSANSIVPPYIAASAIRQQNASIIENPACLNSFSIRSGS